MSNPEIRGISPARLRQILEAAFTPGCTIEFGTRPGIIISQEEFSVLHAARVLFSAGGRVGSSAQGRDLWNRLRAADLAKGDGE